MTAGLGNRELVELHRAVSAIAARCDGANDRDGQGFMKRDSGFGKMAAGVPPETWDGAIAATVYDMLRKYQSQLTECGIDFDELPVPEGEARRHSKDLVRAITVDDTGRRLVFHFGYSEWLNDRVKKIGGAWNPTLQRMVAPITAIDDARRMAADCEFTLSAEVRDLRLADLPAEALKEPGLGCVSYVDGELDVWLDGYQAPIVAKLKKLPTRRFTGLSWRMPAWLLSQVMDIAAEYGLDVDETVNDVPPDEKMPVTVDRDGDYLVVKFQWHADLREALAALGGRWSGTHGGWLVPVEQATGVADALVACNLGDSGLAAIEAAKTVASVIAASRALDAEDLPPIPGLKGGELRPFQRAGVAYVLWARRSFIADDMGLGKTVQALAAIEAAGAYPAVVTMPGFLKLNWAPEVRKWLPGRSVVVVNGRKARPFGLFRPDIILVNFDILGVEPDDPDKPVWSVETTRPTGWTRELIELGPMAVVADESQYLRGHQSLRTIAATHLADAVPRPDGLVLALTGTPVVNQRVEAASQIRFLGRLDEFGGSRASVKRMGDLARQLRQRCMVRRLKVDVEPELPARTYTPVIVEGDPAGMREYQRAEDDLLTYLADKARALALETGLDPEDEAFKARLRAGAAEHLVAVTVLKQLAAKARMRAVEQWVENFLRSGKKLLVFAHHKTILHELGNKFGCRVIEGGVSSETRQRYVAEFQEDPDVRLLVIGITAGGAGLTLTAASDVLFVEQDWSPANHDQALDRCYGRLNDMHGASGWVMTIEGTIDETIAELIDSKRAEVTNAVDGDRRSDEVDDPTGNKAGSIFADLVVRLTDQALERQPA